MFQTKNRATTIPDGFPKFKGPKKAKSSWLKPMSDKTKARQPLRKQVIDETHERSNNTCETKWIAPDIKCSTKLHTDEKYTRGRSGGTTQYSTEHTQSICAKCDHCKENEIWAAEILGLYGQQGLTKHEPITQADRQRATILFRNAKKRCHFG